MNTTSVIVIIPARIGSSRLPSKPLVDLAGKTVVQRVWEKAKQILCADEVVISTDSIVVMKAAEEFGAKVVMTGQCRTGSDRVALTMWDYFPDNQPRDIVVNLQGDLPFVDPEVVDDLVAVLIADPKANMATPAIRRSHTNQLWESPDTVKALKGVGGQAQYFSRSPIPNGIPKLGYWLHHYGVYAWRNESLQVVAGSNPTSWEIAEGLEQLRALELGMKVRLVETRFEPGVEINTWEDLAAARSFLAGLEEGK